MVRGNSLSDDLSILVNNPKYSDLEIKCKDGAILYGNSAVLAARSEVFDRTLFTRVSENLDKQISFPKIESSHMKIILEYLYTGILLEKDITADNAFEILYAADFFQLEKLQDLISECYKKMCTKEGIENKSPELLSKAVRLMSPTADNGTIRYLADAVAKIPLDFIEFDRLSLQGLQCMLSKRDTKKTFVSSEYSVFRFTVLTAAKSISHEAFSTLEKKLQPWMEVKEVPQTLKNNDSMKKEISTSVADIIRPIVEYIDFKRINAMIIAKIIEPLDIISSSKIMDSYRSLAFQAAPLSPFYGVPLFIWDQKGCGMGLEINDNGRTVSASENVINYRSVRTSNPMSSGVYEFHVLIKKFSNYSFIGVCEEEYDFYKHPGEQLYGWVFCSSGKVFHNNQRLISNSKFNENSRIIVHLDMDNKTVSISVDDIRYPPVASWTNLPSKLYFVASLRYPGMFKILHPDEQIII
ncbi:1958_t:CDS:1 [Acaulospora colombiana]|uniref:1958_t:CDS:1 n=1 Tax=Acaulospora colombiana TaxID=27376 RepID=A0ACA9L4Z9_9GLOM|nr:1958_t:CDS:1 [Acaulospora colombiana]